MAYTYLSVLAYYNTSKRNTLRFYSKENSYGIFANTFKDLIVEIIFDMTKCYCKQNTRYKNNKTRNKFENLRTLSNSIHIHRLPPLFIDLVFLTN